MRCVTIALLFMYIACSQINAGLPVGISVETKCGCCLCTGAINSENEIVLEKEFSLLNGVTVGAENLAVYAGDAFANETTIGTSVCVADFLRTGIAGKIFSENEVSYGINGIVIVGYAFENWKLTIENENEFLHTISTKGIEYVNTLTLNKVVRNSGKTGLGFILENELVTSESEMGNELLIGPYLGHGFFTAYINYSLSISSEPPSHGAYLGTVFEF